MRKRNLTVSLALLLGIGAALLFSSPAFSFLPEYASGSSVLVHWASAPTWRINPMIGSNVLGVTDPTSVIAASFNTWKNAPNVSSSVSGTTQGANTNIEAHAQDGVNLVCFNCCSNDFGTGGDTLAITYTSFTSSSGVLSDADILFNPDDDLLANGAACPSGKTCGDLQTVATHEIGHFYGLDHSAISSAVMFPFAPDQQLNLSADDAAAISNTYPGTQTFSTGQLSGRITNASGAGICGAHVFAESNTAATGYPSPVRKTPVGAMTRADGTYTIVGLPPDSYGVTAEPLDGPVDQTNLQGYASGVCGASTLPTNLTSRQY